MILTVSVVAITVWAVFVVYWAAGRYLVVAAPETSFGDIGDGLVLGMLPALAVVVFLLRRGLIEPPSRGVDEVSEA